MLKTRVIPTLLYKDFGLVKGTAFDSRRAVGSPMQAIKVYEMRGVDELVLFDVTATLQERRPDFELVDDLADDCFMPLTVGGGVRSIEDVRRLLQVGADKVCLGTAALERAELIEESASRFGSQCVVVSIDVRREDGHDPTVWSRSGTTDTGRSPAEVAKDVEVRGAGEIILQSIDRDGTMTGYDLDLLRDVCQAVTIPVVASGGAGTYDDMLQAVRDGGASAVAAASMFHFTEQTPRGAKDHLHEHGVAVRGSSP
jgi:cyclase